jgi:hypothetical protein
MRSTKSLLAAAAFLLAGVSLGAVGCHYDRDTAGRPDAERGDGELGSTAYTKEGTGDPKVGEGRGQVGTDARPKSNSTDQPVDSGAKGDATGGNPDLKQK